mgnify:CR=1 FL=1
MKKFLVPGAIGVGSALIVGLIGYGIYSGNAWIKGKDAQITELSSNFEAQKTAYSELETSNSALKTDYEATNKELGDLKAEYGIALSDKEKAQQSASRAQTEASKAKTEAESAKQETQEVQDQNSVLSWYLGKFSDLTDLLNTQKTLYKQAAKAMNTGAYYVLYKDYDSAAYYIGLAEDYISQAMALDSRINAIADEMVN